MPRSEITLTVNRVVRTIEPDTTTRLLDLLRERLRLTARRSVVTTGSVARITPAKLVASLIPISAQRRAVLPAVGKIRGR